jgi:rhamnulose-1-phosphate aldolase/alcohol dehydrogenase
MQSRWSDAQAQQFLERYGPAHGEDLALRVYTSRLIGSDPDLVLHGGGNTSVKTIVRDLVGDEVFVLCVKGSGSDLEDVEPRGLPAVRLQPLLRLRALARLTDEEMVNQVRIQLLDASAPTPSVETLLHAFVPSKYVDHTHADAICVLTNQPDGATLVREALGPRVQVLPWIMPGFPLAKAVADAFESDPRCEGIVLEKHGIFTFGQDARQSYERMVELVEKAERFLQRRIAGKQTLLDGGATDAAAARELATETLPVVRGALGARQRWIAAWRGAADLVRFSLSPRARDLLALGPLTPDHVIRTKASYLWLAAAEARDPERCRAAVQGYEQSYADYFRAHQGRVARPPVMLPPNPLVVVVEGAGLFAFGGSQKAARIAADIAEHTLRGKARGDALGRYTPLSPGELFEMEYWSLEQAKLGKDKPPLLQGQIALLTGAGGAIGHGIAQALLEAGACVLVTDRDEQRLQVVWDQLAKFHSSLRRCAMDVTDAASVRAAFELCCREFGGVDIVVPNAGIAYVAPLAEIDPQRFRSVVDVNLTGTMLVLQQAARVFARQRTGGSVIVQASKNVFDPGASFGAYSASKSGAHQLGKIAALELAPLGVRVNMVNADAVFGGEVASGLWAEVGPERMKARGLDAEGLKDFYRQRSLLKVEVLPAHVGAAVVFFASGVTPTTGATLPVDGGIPGAFPR